MTVSEEELPAVAGAAHAVVREAKAAGVWVCGGGINESVPAVLVAGDGSLTEGTYPQTRQIEGGYTVLEVPTRRPRWSGQPRSRAPAGAPRRSGSSCTTRKADGRVPHLQLSP